MKSHRKRRGRGEGSLYPYGDGWAASIVVGYHPNGNARRKSVYGKTKKEVQEKLRVLLEKKATGKLDVSQFTMAEFLEYWLTNSVKDRKDAGTEQLYRQRVRDHIVPHIGQIRLTKLTDVHIDHLLTDLRSAGKSTDLCRKVGELLRRVLRFAMKKGLVSDNAASKVDLPTVRVEEIHPLTEEQVRAFLKAAEKNRLYALYLLALDTGMRQGEIIALDWTDFDFEAGTVSITKSATRTGVKGGVRIKEVKTPASRRKLRLGTMTLEALKWFREKTPGKGMVAFPTRGKGLRYGEDRHLDKGVLLRSFKRLLRKAGLPEIRFHDLRHTHATLALQRTKNIKAISKRLGHEDITVTLNTYAHFLPEMEEEIVDAWAAIVTPSNE